MWNPKKLIIKNLFAHEYSEVEFKTNTCTVITGVNKTDPGFENNGSGKSTIVEAIFMSLTGDSLRGLNKEDFINSNADECYLEFYLENPVLNEQLAIKRTIHRKRSAVVKIEYEGGEQAEQLTTVPETNAWILKKIGLTKEDLSRYYIISQDSRYTFFTANDVEKKEIINRITSANMIDSVIAEIDIRFKEKSEEISASKLSVNDYASKVEIISEQIEEAAEEEDNTEEINRLNESIEELKSETETVKKVISKKQAELSKLKSSKEELQKAVKDTSSIELKIKETVKKMREAESAISTLEHIIGETITCPNCNHEFMLENTELTIDEAKSMLEETLLIKEELAKQKNTLNKKLQKEEENLESVRVINSKIKSAEYDLKNYDLEIVHFSKKITKLAAEIEELKKSKENSMITGLIKKKEELQAALSLEDERLEKLKEDLEIISFWKYNMGKMGFATYLANKSIKIIEGIINSFLLKFKTEISVLMNGYKILKDSSLREKIDIFIRKDGVTASSYLSNSGGERGRVNLAGILGIHHLLNMSRNGRGLNLIILDEVFPGIDSIGQENIIRILEGLGITVLMITQVVSTGFNYQNEIRVQKIDGVSEIVK